MKAKTTKKTTPKTEKSPAKMGRPETAVDEKRLTALMRMKPSLQDTAHFLDCSTSAIERYIKRHHDMTFAEFRDKNMVTTRFSLIRTAIQKANAGDNVMLIFCLKNLCGWKDRHENSLEEERPIKLAYEVTVQKNKDGVWEM